MNKLKILSQNSTRLPKKLKYSIRLPNNPSRDVWLTDQLYFVALTKTAREPNSYPFTPPYFSYCFLTIQNDIERAFIKSASKQEVPSTRLQRFPYPNVSEDLFVPVAGALFPFLLMCCMFLSVKNIIKVSESLQVNKLICGRTMMKYLSTERDD